MSKQPNKTAQDLYEEVQQLSADERELLVAKLNQNDPPGFASPEIETAWLNEVRRRRTLHAQGKTKDVPGEEVFAALHQKISG
jgi:putative addiction module component (TIGR02574 family)